MSSYNTTTISNVFAYLYSLLRRQYAQYAANYAGRQYFLFANVVLKRPDRIPYYSTVEGARIKSNPAGYLPTDISAYYFKERPVYFYNQTAFLESRVLGNAGTYDINSNPPYIILNIYLSGSYQDVYVNYDPSKMSLTLNAMDTLIFVTNETEIRALQKLLSDILTQLTIAYNQVKLLEQAKAQGKYNNDNFLYRAKYGAKVQVDGWISSLQNDNRFIVKVCAECNNNAQLGDLFTAPITYITMAGAISLTWLMSSYSQYDQVKEYLENLQIDLDRLRIDLDTQWKLVGNPTYKPTEAAVKAMDTVTVTAKKKTAGIPNWALWVIGGIVIIKAAKKEKQP
jgi:hypothetical protein